ncbi:unnamed protein product [Vicia faba]|uniref:Uncharacterized protein n=1 Tax=Vicia faba TaxID=3906 RepID=A0AAV1AVK1_VICFA|nr:unnamed protein product [Vicia faba]
MWHYDLKFSFEHGLGPHNKDTYVLKFGEDMNGYEVANIYVEHIVDELIFIIEDGVRKEGELHVKKRKEVHVEESEEIYNGESINLPVMRRALDRLKKKINKANDEPSSSNILPRSLTTVKCKSCRTFGHNSRTCKGKTSADRQLLKGS